MKRLFVVLLLLLYFNASARKPEESKKFYKELHKFYGTENVQITKLNHLSVKNDFIYEITDKEKDLGIVVLTSVRGRHDWFEFFIIYNPELDIQLIKVLVYRSEYGSEITAKRWLSQFYKKQKDSLKYGSDIQAISGATFSAMALTNNVNRINKMLLEYFAK